MLTIPLQSGSNGNCIYVEAGGVRLLFDAGISGRRAKERLARFGRRIEDVDAVVISHDHSDHTSTMGVFHRKFGLPIWATPATFAAAGRRRPLGKIERVNHFKAGATLSFRAGGGQNGNGGGDKVLVETIPTPHDGADGVAFVVEHDGQRLGILTDLGHRFEELDAVVGSLDAVLLESNYEPDMLDHGPYPEFLKARIRGSGGHISNRDSAKLLCDSGKRMQWACLAHLSADNNSPAVAVQAHEKILGKARSKRLQLHVAGRYDATGILEVGGQRAEDRGQRTEDRLLAQPLAAVLGTGVAGRGGGLIVTYG